MLFNTEVQKRIHKAEGIFNFEFNTLGSDCTEYHIIELVVANPEFDRTGLAY